MTAHTPGPWSVYEDANKVAAHGAKHLISSSAYGDYYTESLTDERGEFFNPADARLIAAAPELLGALEGALKALEGVANEMTVGDRFTNAGQGLLDALMPARDAIAKAKGESDGR